MTMTMTNYDEVRNQWQPAPASELAVTLGRAEEAAVRWAEVHERLQAASAERATVQQRLDAAQLGSNVQAVAEDIGRAEALDLVIMRGQLELNRLRVKVADAARDVEMVTSDLRVADRDVTEATRRWGEDSSDATHAKRARHALHRRYLATPEPAAALGVAEVS